MPVGQYSEPQVGGFVEGSGAGFQLWGGLGWLVFFHLLYVTNESVKVGSESLCEDARGPKQSAWRLLFFTWFLYGLAYVVPAIPGINQSGDWVVVRQLVYTFADVVPKTVFGVLSRVAILQSDAEGKEPGALRAMS